MKTVLTIAGFDPSSGAGVTADLMVFAAHGLFGTACISSLTVQSTVGVFSSHPVAPEILKSTLECLSEDLPSSGIKIGMLANAACVEVVAEYIESIRARGVKIPVVLDPVIHSSSGRQLLDPPGLDALKHRLIPLIDWVTPNVAELEVLTGSHIVDSRDMVEAATKFQNDQTSCVTRAITTNRSITGLFAKGGHLPSPDDVLFQPGVEPRWFRGTRIESTSTHGTGCALSSAFLSLLVLGQSPKEAAAGAKAYVAEAMRSAVPLGRGRGPLNHLWPLRTNRVDTANHDRLATDEPERP